MASRRTALLIFTATMLSFSVLVQDASAASLLLDNEFDDLANQQLNNFTSLEIIETNEIGDPAAINDTVDAFSFLFGVQLLDGAVQMVKSTNMIKRIMLEFVLQLRSILIKHGIKYNSKIHRILEDGIVDAQSSISPVLISIRTILLIVPDAQSITGVNSVIVSVQRIAVRLQTQIQEANSKLVELLFDVMGKLRQITSETGTGIYLEVKELIYRSASNLHAAADPLYRFWQDPSSRIGTGKSTSVLDTVLQLWRFADQAFSFMKN